MVDMSRRSLTYESRLYKYTLRGFGVWVPGFDMNEVDRIRLRAKHVNQAIGIKIYCFYFYFLIFFNYFYFILLFILIF